jgi:hypothetical protein
MHSCWGMSLMEQVIRLTILQQRHQVFKSYKSGDDCWFTSQYVKQIKPTHEYAVLVRSLLS